MNILIVSHQGVASGIASAAQMIVGDISQIHTIELTEAGVDVFADELENYLKEWLSKDTGIVLADLKGGTPCNVAMMAMGTYPQLRVVAGLNLAMAIEAAVSPVENVDELAAYLTQIGQSAVTTNDFPELTDEEEFEE